MRPKARWCSSRVARHHQQRHEPAECLAESIIAAKAAQAACHVGPDAYDFSGAYGGADNSGCSDASHGRSQESGGLQSPQLGDAGGAKEIAPRHDQSSGDSFKTAPSQIEAPSRAGASQAVQQSPAALPLLPSPGCRSTRCKAGRNVSTKIYSKQVVLLHAISATAKRMLTVVSDPRCQNCSMQLNVTPAVQAACNTAELRGLHRQQPVAAARVRG